MESQRNELESDLERLKNEIHSLRKNSAQDDAELQKLRDALQDKKLRKSGLEMDIDYAKKEIANCKNSVETLDSEIKNYIAEHNIDEASIAEISDYPQMAQYQIDEFFGEFLVLSGEIKSLGDIDLTDISGEIQKIREEYEILNSEYAESQQQLGAYNTEIENMKEKLERKNKLVKTYEQLALRKENLDFLKKLFKGSAFVHFIGQKYLSKLCYTANKRFLRFTQNQFELSAPEEFDEKKGKITIIDRLSGGSKRDMMTLSGGQSFQAALALALALADESGAGHRFFFVDEGFGTFDQSSLYLVLESLRDLVINEKRVVGLISHIPLMKEEVNAYLQVTLDKASGTQIEFFD